MATSSGSDALRLFFLLDIAQLLADISLDTLKQMVINLLLNELKLGWLEKYQVGHLIGAFMLHLGCKPQYVALLILIL